MNSTATPQPLKHLWAQIGCRTPMALVSSPRSVIELLELVELTQTDTMDAKNIRLTNFVYQGGDDCIAIKPRSYNIYVHNATCRGGNGMAIGSLGQYLEDSSVENVVVDDVRIIRYNEDMHDSAYIKTWVGDLVPQNPSANGYYENAGQPRGGGWGSVRNILFSNFIVRPKPFVRYRFHDMMLILNSRSRAQTQVQASMRTRATTVAIRAPA